MKKRYILVSIFFIFMFCTPVFSKIDADFTGYIEDTMIGEYMKNEKDTNITQIGRARMTCSGKYGETGDFGITFIGGLYSGATTIYLNDYLPRDVVKAQAVKIPYKLESDYWLQEAYGSLYLNRFTFRAGRQKYYTGTGYAWNPTDLFNHKNVFDPTYEIEGLDSMLAEYSLNSRLKFSLFYSFGTNHDNEDREGQTLGDNDFQVKIKTRARMWDMAVCYSDVKKTYLDFSTFLPDTIKWQLVSAELSGGFFGMGIHAEGGYAWLENKNGRLPDGFKDNTRFLVGADYTFENELFIMAEYYFEGLGKTEKSEYQLNNRLYYFTGDMDSIGRDNLFLGMRYPVTDLVSFECYFISNLNDPSVVINPWIIWIASDDIVVSASGQIPVADGDETSLGRSGTNMFVRFNFSF